MNDKAKHIQNGRSRGAHKHAASSRVTDLCTCATEDALRQLESGRLGLTQEQVEARRERYGSIPGEENRAARRASEKADRFARLASIGLEGDILRKRRSREQEETDRMAYLHGRTIIS